MRAERWEWTFVVSGGWMIGMECLELAELQSRQIPISNNARLSYIYLNLSITSVDRLICNVQLLQEDRIYRLPA